MSPRRRHQTFSPHVAPLIFVVLIAATEAVSIRAAQPPQQIRRLPPAAVEVLHDLYSGDTEAATSAAIRMQSNSPKGPLGYLLEGEVRWWRLYCTSLEYHFNFLEMKRLPHAAKDDADLALATHEISLSESLLAGTETAEMHLYAGMGYALRARLMDLHSDHGGTARAGIRAREHFLRAKELDPEMADADFGLGLYNYYVDTLSGIARALRFFMGIPGGSKKDGVRQLENAIAHGEMTAPEARFYLAVNLRTYDREYERAAELLEPLARDYPQNPVFTLMLANMNSLLNRKEKAEALFRAAASMASGDSACAARVKEISAAGIAKLAAVASNSN